MWPVDQAVSTLVWPPCHERGCCHFWVLSWAHQALQKLVLLLLPSPPNPTIKCPLLPPSILLLHTLAHALPFHLPGKGHSFKSPRERTCLLLCPSSVSLC